MKYPNIILFRNLKYKDIDEFIKNHEDEYNCNFNIIDDPDMINKLYNPNYHILVSVDDTFGQYRVPIFNKYYNNRFLFRTLHKTMNDVKNITEFNKQINYCYINNVIKNRETTRPIFSLYTLSYNSWDKIINSYKSIINQRLNDWEWIIMDSSDDEEHFKFLSKLASTDERIRIFKHYRNCFNIGDIKNESICLCRGKYLLEILPDDEILTDCLIDAVNIFDKDPEIGFIYMDFITSKFENNNSYDGYYMEKYNNEWVYVYSTPNINNITLSDTSSIPKYPKIWRNDFLKRIGNYSESLAIYNDYEILLKTMINCKCIKINKISYINRNDNNNLKESNDINVYLQRQIYEYYNINEVMKEKGGYDNCKYILDNSLIWKRGVDFISNYVNKRIVLNYDKQYCIIGKILYSDRVRKLYQNICNDFIVISNIDNHKKLTTELDNLKYTRMKCYSLKDCDINELIQYFKLIYKADNCEYEILMNDE